MSGLPPLLAYPERRWSPPGMLDQITIGLVAALRARASRGRARRLGAITPSIDRRGPALRMLSDGALQMAARKAGTDLRAAYARGGALDLEIVAGVLAPVAEAAYRVLGQRPYVPQLVAAHGCAQGMMVEMATGEGKTLAASLAAATVAMSGMPVHVLSVNRYLAERDAGFAAPLYRFLGLDLGLVTESVSPEDRRAAYRCDITFAVSKEVAFDYMRDRMALGRGLANARLKTAALAGRGGAAPLLRGLHHAIIDEADSALIDEARTPLILSAGDTGVDREIEMFDRALALSDEMRVGVDYLSLVGERRCALLAAGCARLASRLGADPPPPWDVASEREELVEQALAARHMLLRDEHYMVRDGSIEIVDEFTGRVLPDRVWSDGLQELVERKEGLALSPRNETKARLTFQRFARRYHRLSGLSGTLHEVAAELWRVYDVRVARIAPRLPDRKVIEPGAGYLDARAKWQAIADKVAAWQRAGVPVLIGTRTVTASAEASAVLTDRGVSHVVLNAAQDSQEAAIVAAAGRPGSVTVATNMAGRGTDILIDRDVEAAGGLRVVVTEPHEARRIDRQLIGRCGRQGQPGQAQVYVSLDDALLWRHGTRIERGLARALHGVTRGCAAVWLARRAQRRSERLHAGMRRDLLRADAWNESAIGFAGEAARDRASAMSAASTPESNSAMT